MSHGTSGKISQRAIHALYFISFYSTIIFNMESPEKKMKFLLISTNITLIFIGSYFFLIFFYISSYSYVFMLHTEFSALLVLLIISTKHIVLQFKIWVLPKHKWFAQQWHARVLPTAVRFILVLFTSTQHSQQDAYQETTKQLST